MKKHLLIFGFVTALLQFACSGDETVPNTEPSPVVDEFIRAADISLLPKLEAQSTPLFSGAVEQDMLSTLKIAGCNTVRIRLWKNPSDPDSGLTQVQALANRAKLAGFKVWLTVHYSDTWADPGAQATPASWQLLNFASLKSEVSVYTSEILAQIDPDIFQIGNEINSGFLWPNGHLINNELQCLQLISAASATIRSQSPDTKIMLHFAGIDGSDWFFNKVNTIDYDYIGLSYYPMYHGKQLSNVQNAINSLGQAHSKKVIIAETSYPFTLGWNDWTNNVLGLDEQLIPQYQATPEGQKNFMLALRETIESSSYGHGFSYWGGEWISFMGDQAANGSSWENQALYDFNNKALPVMAVFNE